MARNLSKCGRAPSSAWRRLEEQWQSDIEVAMLEEHLEFPGVTQGCFYTHMMINQDHAVMTQREFEIIRRPRTKKRIYTKRLVQVCTSDLADIAKRQMQEYQSSASMRPINERPSAKQNQQEQHGGMCVRATASVCHVHTHIYTQAYIQHAHFTKSVGWGASHVSVEDLCEQGRTKSHE